MVYKVLSIPNELSINRKQIINLPSEVAGDGEGACKGVS